MDGARASQGNRLHSVPFSPQHVRKMRRIARIGGMTYRPDIDGLRAVAVLAVIGIHAFPGWVPGGFVGVDVFFVISGYLISGLVMGEMRQGKFRLIAFYARRARRIF